ncbi:MAG: ADP-forming succinate--CoA ligase subunit beta [Gammaproteobacteria bacterium]|nr:ADP-forming succinate--CoA ligase subunit beta [Gammaproteobacteria bacterium]MDH5693564.1 ADP-forming succinate--CoA ligase subunit beta [Gammaproteobacteria bacterium]
MQIHEYQAKQLLRAYGIPVPEGHTAHSVDEARSISRLLGGEQWIVKAQVHSSGRAMAGAVRLAKSVDELLEIVDEMLESRFLIESIHVEGGLPINAVLIEEPLEIAQQLYLAISVDRDEDRIMCVASEDGGIGFQALIAHEPDHLYRVSVDPVVGLLPYHCRQVAQRLGLPSFQYGPFSDFLTRLYRFFVENDITSLEINPLARLVNGQFVTVNAQVHIDDNALFRHSNLQDLRDFAQEDPKEVSAEQHGLSYVRLGGNIGCLVNGAGLAMATMDLIKLNRGDPANFMDVGGTVTAPRVSEALRVLSAEEQVQAILVNIFGGIVRCDIVANGLVEAARELGVKVPIVVRFAGNHAEEGIEIIRSSGLPIQCISDLNQAAESVVALVRDKR